MLRYRPKHKSFEYKPRFYDAEKEELMQRVNKYNQEGKDVDLETRKHNILQAFRSSRPDRSQLDLKKKLAREYNIRIVLILLALGFLVYMVLMTNQIIRLD